MIVLVGSKINASRVIYGNEEYSKVCVGNTTVWEKDSDVVNISYDTSRGIVTPSTTADVDWNGKYVGSFSSGVTIYGDNVTIPWNALGINNGLGDIVVTGGVRKLVFNPFGTNFNSLTLPNHTITIDYELCSNASVKSLTLPSIEFFPQYACACCRQLTALTIGDCPIFFDSCFRECTALQHLVLPSSTSILVDGCFYGCTGLIDITINATKPPHLEESGNLVFGNTNNCPIYVPAESVDAYLSSPYWTNYYSRLRAIS